MTSPSKKSRPFPWRCITCGKPEVIPATIPYTCEIRSGGRLHTIFVPELTIPICKACGEKVFTNSVDDQIEDALQAHLKNYDLVLNTTC